MQVAEGMVTISGCLMLGVEVVGSMQGLQEHMSPLHSRPPSPARTTVHATAHRAARDAAALCSTFWYCFRSAPGAPAARPSLYAESKMWLTLWLSVSPATLASPGSSASARRAHLASPVSA